MEEDKLIDQSELAESVAKSIKYNFLDHFLVKPLDPVKVKKEISKPVLANKATKDSNGIEAVDIEDVETEVKEVDSDYRRGVVLKRPLYYEYQKRDDSPSEVEIKVGDIVIFHETAGRTFDLLKDSKLIRQYDIIGIER